MAVGRNPVSCQTQSVNPGSLGLGDPKAPPLAELPKRGVAQERDTRPCLPDRYDQSWDAGAVLERRGVNAKALNGSLPHFRGGGLEHDLARDVADEPGRRREFLSQLLGTPTGTSQEQTCLSHCQAFDQFAKRVSRGEDDDAGASVVGSPG